MVAENWAGGVVVVREVVSFRGRSVVIGLGFWLVMLLLIIDAVRAVGSLGIWLCWASVVV